MSRFKRHHLAVLQAIAMVLAWSSNYSAQKALMAVIGPEAMLFVRYLVTPACAVALLLWHYGVHWPGPPRRDWVMLAGLAMLGHIGQVSVMTHALSLSTPFSTALISALGPVFTLMLVRILWSQRLARIQLFGVLLAMAGVLVFLADKLSLAGSQDLGDLLLLLGTVLFSAHTVPVMAYSTLLAALPILLINGQQAMQMA